MRNPLRVFKEALLLFWALWWTIAFLTDLLGSLKQMGLTHAAWITNSNYPFLVQSLKLYSAPLWFASVLYSLIIAWLFIISIMFWWAEFSSRNPRKKWQQKVNWAFVISLGLWLAFFIADQIIMNFDLEQNHMVQGGFELLSFLYFYIEPPGKTYKITSGSIQKSSF